MGYGEPALIITDGGLAGLLACFMEGVCRPAASLPRDKHGASEPAAQSTAWFWWSGHAEQEREAREASARAGLGVCHLAQLVVPLVEEERLATGQRPARPSGETLSKMLLLAGSDAIKRGLSRLIWPAHLGGPGGSSERLADHSGGLDAIADVCDRAMAAARLLSLDAGPEGFSIQTPFVDFTDAQIADLASDVDLPLEQAFLGSAEGIGASEYRRWAKALSVVGLDMPPVPSRLTTTVLGSVSRLKAV
ncbi:MAG: hypothetical protein ACKVS8_06810 [Phycisphaerales bacterium]